MLHPVKNQHYVPQFVLRNFSVGKENFIWSFDKYSFYKKWKCVEEKSIKTVASQEYFYDKEVLHEKASIEFNLSQIENEVAPIISKIIATENIQLINDSERNLLSIFISLQITRTSESLKETERFQEDFTGQMKEKANLDFDGINARELWLSLINEANYFVPFIFNKTWHLFRSDQLFYTSDNPVVRNNTINISELRGTLGINSDGIEIYFPLNHSIVLAMFCERTISIKSGTYDTPLQSIPYLNSLQVRQSDRFVFSSKNDFDLVFSMLNI